jgi:hypothetical protein
MKPNIKVQATRVVLGDTILTSTRTNLLLLKQKSLKNTSQTRKRGEISLVQARLLRAHRAPVVKIVKRKVRKRRRLKEV